MTFTHGASAYVNHHCRCAVCRAGNAERTRIRRHQRREYGARNPSCIPHGYGGYANWLCRFPICAEANRASCAERYHKRRSA